MDWLKDWIVWAFNWTQETLWEIGNAVVQPVIDALEDFSNTGDSHQYFGDYWQGVDYWVPLTESIGLYSSLLTLRLTVITVRWILKLIPTIG